MSKRIRKLEVKPSQENSTLNQPVHRKTSPLVEQNPNVHSYIHSRDYLIKRSMWHIGDCRHLKGIVVLCLHLTMLRHSTEWYIILNKTSLNLHTKANNHQLHFRVGTEVQNCPKELKCSHNLKGGRKMVLFFHQLHLLQSCHFSDLKH